MSGWLRETVAKEWRGRYSQGVVRAHALGVLLTVAEAMQVGLLVARGLEGEKL